MCVCIYPLYILYYFYMVSKSNIAVNIEATTQRAISSLPGGEHEAFTSPPFVCLTADSVTPLSLSFVSISYTRLFLFFSISCVCMCIVDVEDCVGNGCIIRACAGA